jgi:uncharacterized protein
MRYAVILFLFVNFCLNAEIVETVYKDFEVDEQIILDLITSPAFQRLKHVHQYGVVKYFEQNCEEYSRYDHSLGVWALLRENNCSLEEQIAGLLHDVSHTVFSHFGDYFFKHFSDTESFQDTIHAWYIKNSGIDEILEQYGFAVDDVLYKSGNFHAASRPLPNLSADRGDYNIQGAYLHGDITKDELIELFNDLSYQNGHWTLSNIDLAEKIGYFSLHMTMYCWSGPYQNFANNLLADVINIMIEEGVLTLDDVYFGLDDEVWKKLWQSDNPEVINGLYKILTVHDQIIPCQENEADYIYHIKFRGINPMIRTEKGLLPLTELSSKYAKKFKEVKSQAKKGWAMQKAPNKKQGFFTKYRSKVGLGM